MLKCQTTTSVEWARKRGTRRQRERGTQSEDGAERGRGGEVAWHPRPQSRTNAMIKYTLLSMFHSDFKFGPPGTIIHPLLQGSPSGGTWGLTATAMFDPPTPLCLVCPAPEPPTLSPPPPHLYPPPPSPTLFLSPQEKNTIGQLHGIAPSVIERTPPRQNQQIWLPRST